MIIKVDKVYYARKKIKNHGFPPKNFYPCILFSTFYWSIERPSKETKIDKMLAKSWPKVHTKSTESPHEMHKQCPKSKLLMVQKLQGGDKKWTIGAI